MEPEKPILNSIFHIRFKNLRGAFDNNFFGMGCRMGALGEVKSRRWKWSLEWTLSLRLGWMPGQFVISYQKTTICDNLDMKLEIVMLYSENWPHL